MLDGNGVRALSHVASERDPHVLVDAERAVCSHFASLAHALTPRVERCDIALEDDGWVFCEEVIHKNILTVSQS